MVDFTRAITPPPDDRYDRSAPRVTRTYYRRGAVSVTDQWFAIDGRRYAVSGLSRLRTVRGPRNPIARGVTLVAALLTLAVAVGWQRFGEATVWVGVAALALLPAGLAAATWRIRQRHFELWADYHGESIQLLITTDERVYGAITRALIRAREAATPPDNMIASLGTPTPI